MTNPMVDFLTFANNPERGEKLVSSVVNGIIYYYYYYYYYYYTYSALGPVWAETGAQSGDWYGSGTLHPGQVSRG